VLQIYRERKLLAQCIRDTSQALGKIDIILFILVMVVNVFLCITAIFNVNLYQALVPMGTFIMGLSFMFSNTVKVAFESIMFLFVTHPYDAGDNVLIDDTTLTVHNMGITGTVFIRGDGQKVYAPTTVLMTKLITNVRRSGDMGESILINVDFRTSTDLVFTLRERLAAWVNDQPREFSTGFDVRLQDILDVNKLVLTVWLPHKGNWQNVGKRLQRRNRFMFMLKDTLDDLNIHYELPAQRFTSNSEFFDKANRLASETMQTFAPGSPTAPSSLATGNARPHHVRMYGYTQSTSAEADGG
jgi:small-conductance mechanosensitive channel